MGLSHEITLLALFARRQLLCSSTSKPNAVIIFIDDMGYEDIGPFGSDPFHPSPRPHGQGGDETD